MDKECVFARGAFAHQTVVVNGARREALPRRRERFSAGNKAAETLMPANPALGVALHALGGLAAASFYLPFKRVSGWAWETYWLVGGFASWVLAPWIVAWSCPPK